MEKLSMQTTNIVDENIKRIGELFPNCLTERLNNEGKPEAAIDFDQLRQEVSKDMAKLTTEEFIKWYKRFPKYLQIDYNMYPASHKVLVIFFEYFC